MAVVTAIRRLRNQLAQPLYRNAIYLIGADALTGVVGLGFWLVAARLHDADTIGLASATISAMLLLSTLGTLGLDYAIVRFLPRSSSVPATINTSLTVAAIASALMSAVFVAGLGWWSPVLVFIREEALPFVGFVVFTMAYTLYVVETRVFVARRRSEFSLIQSVVFNASRIGLLALLAVFFGVFGIVSAWGIAVILALTLGVLVFQPLLEAGYRPRPIIVRQVVDKLVRYSFGNYVAAMLWTAPRYVLPLMVANLVGAQSNAYFYIAWSMANVLFQVPMAISFSLLAEGSSDERTLGQNVRRSLAFTFVIVMPGILLFTLFGNRLLSYFEPEYADNAASLLRILAVSAVPLTVNCMYFVVERVRMRMSAVILLNALVTLMTLVVSWALLPRIGLAGAGVAWLVSQSVAALAAVFLLVRRSRGGGGQSRD